MPFSVNIKISEGLKVDLSIGINNFIRHDKGL